MKKKPSFFITLEGIEGCGKSTQLVYVAEFLRTRKMPFVLVREPGGTRIGEKIREILLDKKNIKMLAETELLLYCAARAQIVRELILPSLAKGVSVICDRFYDSTIAYQGYGLKMSQPVVRSLSEYASARLRPHLTFLLNIPAALGLERAGRTDRIEARSLDYHERVRRGFLALAKKEPRRIKVIDGSRDILTVKAEIERYLSDVCSR